MWGLDRLFIWRIEPGLLLYGNYDPWLVALSVCVAIFASTMGLHAAWQARDARSANMGRLMRMAGCVSLASGVWAMHFVGMLAFRLCVPVSFDVGTTLLSALPELGAAWVALVLLSQAKFHRPHLVAGGALMGAGIGAMHYIGMAAMRMSASLRYDPTTFGLSVVVAIVLSILALWMRFGLAQRLHDRPWLITLLSGTFMGAAISGMHYTGMAAARFVGQRNPWDTVGLADPAPLALGVTLVTVLATVLVAAASALVRYRQLVQDMAAQATQLRAVVDTAIDGIVVYDGQGKVQVFNAGAERITGIHANDIIGQPMAQLIGSKRREHAERDFAEYIRQYPFGVPEETIARRADGSEAPIRLVVGRAETPNGELYVASFADIGERLAMERALRRSEQQFRSLIGNIPGVSFRARLQRGWPLVYISDAVEGLTGHVPTDFLGVRPLARLKDLVMADEVNRLRDEVMQAVVHGRPFVIEFRLRHRDGSTRWIWGTGRGVRDEDGQTEFVDGVLLDISERRDMEEALRTAKQQAEDAMHARTAFLANMSHEIRTPMNAIIGFTEVVLSSQLDTEARQHLQTVRTAARSLLVLLNDILDSSKLDRGALELEHLPYDLRRVMQQVADEQALNARRKGLALRVECAPEVPAALLGDAHRMRQVLVNLLGNAIKFTERGEVVIGVRAVEPGRLRLSVKDTGIGIAADRLERIFDPFTQADASMSRRYGGTGLGTTISRQLVELMGGRIWAESTLGEGSTFLIDLPCEATSLPERSDTAPRDVAVQLPPMRVLVVDDVEENRQLLKVLLTRDGHTVTMATNGLEAVAAAQAGGIDLILMDLQMPEMDGLTACQRIREHEQAHGQARVPVIALSASVFEEDRSAAQSSGMDGFALKPVEHDQLVAEMYRARAICVGETPSLAPGPTALQPAVPSWSSSSVEVLDVVAGRARWGDDVAWAQSLSQFCRHKRDWLRNNHADQPPAADEAQATGHRFRGVSGNLAMPVLASAAAELERCARQGQSLGGAWRNLHRAVVVTLDAAEAELHALAGTDLASPVASPAQASEAPAATAAVSMDAAAWRSDIALLSQALRAGECPQVEWQRLSQHGSAVLGASIWPTVQQAVDDFDFDAAAAHLDAWLSSHRAPDDLPVEAAS